MTEHENSMGTGLLDPVEGAAVGQEMYDLVVKLFPFCRSITGNGLRETIKTIKEVLPELALHEVPTGTPVFDWVVPNEWNIRDAFIEDEGGHRIVDFKKSNLHVVSYSVPVDQVMDLDDLQKHLHSYPTQPDAIPYVTSYYKENWGFCLTHTQRTSLRPGRYRVRIDSELKPGSLTYGELILPGATGEEIFISTYLCHPSMANDNLSGPVVATAIAKWLSSEKRRFTYRIIFIPETIGSLTYMSQHLAQMKKNTIAGFNLTCVGDNRVFSFMPSRLGTTLADKVALHVLKHKHPDYIPYSFLKRGSDERQYCSPGADLPVVSIMRSRYGDYPEYHTSLDDLSVISPEGLYGSYDALKTCLEVLEVNKTYRSTCIGEPRMGKRFPYHQISTKFSYQNSEKQLKDFLIYVDGAHDLIDIGNIIGVPAWNLFDVVNKLEEQKLII